jgi:hypothetical protein
LNKNVPFDDWSADYELTADIDMSGYDDTSIPLPTAPIGRNGGPGAFTGTLNGNGYVISNLVINSADSYQGLFGKINGGAIENLGLVNVSVHGYSSVGGFCGANYGGTITNCYSTGVVSGETEISVFCGTNDGGTITNCYSSGTVNQVVDEYAGGFVGENTNGGTVGTITDCYTTASVNGIDRVGGFAGSNYGTISNSYATGDVDGDDYVGGFCGYNNGTLSNSYATGDVDGAIQIGGFCGYSSGGSAEIYSCYATGNVTSDAANGKTGGFVGQLWSGASVRYCYSSGDVTQSGNSNAYIGGFCGLFGGNSNSLIEYSYSSGNISHSGTNTSAAIGGFVGGYRDDPQINYCYCISDLLSNAYNNGGFVGRIWEGDDHFTCCYWSSENTPGLSDEGDGTDITEIERVTPTQLSNPATFDCFDFVDDWANGSDVVGSDYPYPMLRAFGYSVIPTLTEWAVILFVGLLAGVGGWFVLRRA